MREWWGGREGSHELMDYEEDAGLKCTMHIRVLNTNQVDDMGQLASKAWISWLLNEVAEYERCIFKVASRRVPCVFHFYLCPIVSCIYFLTLLVILSIKGNRIISQRIV